MKIYDCLPFYNELDMLELHLAEMYDGVDYFIIGEANRTFKGTPKPYYLLENWDRFKPWHDKIRRIEINTPANPDPWVNETEDRDRLYAGLYDAQPNDLVILSDCDEILRSTTMQQLRKLEHIPVFSLRVPQFYFKLNNLQRSYVTADNITLRFHAFTLASRFSTLGGKLSHLKKVQMYSGQIDTAMTKIWHAGWHFSFIGDDSFVQNKINNFDYTWVKDLKGKSIEDISVEWNCEPCAINEYMPRTIRANPERWKDWLIPGNYKDAREILNPNLKL